MKALKFIAPAAMLVLFSAAPRLHAQAMQQQTTTTRTTTTTTDSMPGYADFGYTNDNYAAHHGYQDGYNKGISDHNTGHSFRPTSDHYYNHPIGYNGGPESQSDYNRIYREAFLHGYERGYRQANGQ
jgi:hypothetical protein